MSIALMTAAFKTDLPSTPRLVFLALCDCANDQGECYPSIQNLVGKTGLSDRAIQKNLSELERLGYVRRDTRTGRSTVYWLTPSPRTTFTPEPDSPPNHVHPTPERRSPPPPNHVHPTPERRSPRTINEPSIESSMKQKKAQKRPVPDRPDEVDEQIWQDFLATRGAKRAALTDTALDGIRSESRKAGIPLGEALRICCVKGWTSFNAGWNWKSESQLSASPGQKTKYAAAAVSIFGNPSRNEVIDV